MGLLADATAYLMQRSAPRTATYGRRIPHRGRELPAPEDVWVPTRHGSVRCEVHRAGPDGDRPGYVHFHGGAFVMRYPAMDDFFARHVAATCGAVVLNVDYDVAPQVRYPVAQHEAHDVLAWLATDGGALLGVDRDRIAVGGFSAGGNLAASACLQARDRNTARPVLQLLGVPSLDVAEPVAEKFRGSDGGMLTPRLFRLVRRTYFRDPSRRAEPYASPLRAPDLAGLPPALVVVAERDVLRREAERYADRLRAAGVATRSVRVPEVDHYFLEGSRTGSTLDLLAEALRAALTGPGPRKTTPE